MHHLVIGRIYLVSPIFRMKALVWCHTMDAVHFILIKNQRQLKVRMQIKVPTLKSYPKRKNLDTLIKHPALQKQKVQRHEICATKYCSRVVYYSHSNTPFTTNQCSIEIVFMTQVVRKTPKIYTFINIENLIDTLGET